MSLTRSREAAKEGAKGRWSVFEYEYEYRPPGRTEYEYERGISVRCSVFRRAADGGPRVCAISVARAFQPEFCPFGALWGE
ncbi:MAG: hypothetical protein ACKPJJ_14535, partial [Planctomycetaceae bacterium]